MLPILQLRSPSPLSLPLSPPILSLFSSWREREGEPGQPSGRSKRRAPEWKRIERKGKGATFGLLSLLLSSLSFSLFDHFVPRIFFSCWVRAAGFTWWSARFLARSRGCFGGFIGLTFCRKERLLVRFAVFPHESGRGFFSSSWWGRGLLGASKEGSSLDSCSWWGIAGELRSRRRALQVPLKSIASPIL